MLAKFAEIYFGNELKAETPFTFAGAKELLRLGSLLCHYGAELRENG